MFTQLVYFLCLIGMFVVAIYFSHVPGSPVFLQEYINSLLLSLTDSIIFEMTV